MVRRENRNRRRVGTDVPTGSHYRVRLWRTVAVPIVPTSADTDRSLSLGQSPDDVVLGLRDIRVWNRKRRTGILRSRTR